MRGCVLRGGRRRAYAALDLAGLSVLTCHLCVHTRQGWPENATVSALCASTAPGFQSGSQSWGVALSDWLVVLQLAVSSHSSTS